MTNLVLKPRFETSRFTNLQCLFIQATQTKCLCCDKINSVTESTSFDIPVENKYFVINFQSAKIFL